MNTALAIVLVVAILSTAPLAAFFVKVNREWYEARLRATHNAWRYAMITNTKPLDEEVVFPDGLTFYSDKP